MKAKKYRELDINKICEFQVLTPAQIEMKKLMQQVPLYEHIVPFGHRGIKIYS